MEAKLHGILAGASDGPLAHAIITAFKEVERNFYLEKWKVSQLDAGHFVEAVRRFLELKLKGTYTPIHDKIPEFSSAVLTSYENATGKSESYRIIVPRVLYAAYCIRNKRGVGHLGGITANHMDALHVLSACKWALAEITRVESGLSPDETSKVIEKIVDRRPSGMWEEDGQRRIIAKLRTVEERVLFALFHRSPEKIDELFRLCEIGTRTYFDKKIQKMHKDIMITLKADGTCSILPAGLRRAEEVVAHAVV